MDASIKKLKRRCFVIQAWWMIMNVIYIFIIERDLNNVPFLSSTDIQWSWTKKCPANQPVLPHAAAEAAPVQCSPPAHLTLPGPAGLLPPVRPPELRRAPPPHPGPDPQPVPDAAPQHECLSPISLPDQPTSAPPRPTLPASELPAQPANPHAAVAANHLTPNGAAFPSSWPTGWCGHYQNEKNWNMDVMKHIC